MKNYYNHGKLPVDNEGFYGNGRNYGGAFVPAELKSVLDELSQAYYDAIDDAEFMNQYRSLLVDYVGRPTPLTHARNLSQMFGMEIFLKREDLNHTGAHKINNAIGLALLAKRMGKKRIIAETGAGQHGVAVATVCALLGMECTVFMGATDIERQKPNVERMKMLGAKIVAADAGGATLRNAVDLAFAKWVERRHDSFYLIGSAVGPHPFPEMVSFFQSVISEECARQIRETTGREYPDCVIACVGGGSNASGAFYHFLDIPQVRLVAVEAAGHGVESGMHAATLTCGSKGVLHGALSKVICSPDGDVAEPYSISAGLDYPGVGPLMAWLADSGRMEVLSVTDQEAIAAAALLARSEGIIPALESAHALAALPKIVCRPNDVVVVNLSGRGDKDLQTYIAAGDCPGV